MKSKASFFDRATARMELRRFWPLWALYLLALVLLTVLSMGQGGSYSEFYGVQDFTRIMAGVNFAAAAVLAQLLFGDLYTPRLGYAIHALPISRGQYFGTQVILDIGTTLIANCGAALLIMAQMQDFRVMALWWLGIAELQYLCFFGIAVISAVCSGSRLGMLLHYGILNFLAVMVYWLVGFLLEPLVYGLKDVGTGFLMLAPVYQLSFGCQYIRYTSRRIPDPEVPDRITEEITGVFLRQGDLICLACAAAVGIGLMILAWQLFRRRRPECAGNLLAFEKTKPVFLVLFTLAAGTGMHLVGNVFRYDYGMVMLFVGLILGYYIGLMLLRRQMQVFTWKSLGPICAMCLAVLAVLTVTGLDLLGIGSRVPDVSDLDRVVLRSEYHSGSLTLTEPEDLAAAIQIQRDSLEEHARWEAGHNLFTRIFADEKQDITYGEDRYGWIVMTYHLKDGSEFTRHYIAHANGPASDQLRTFFSRPEIVLGECKVQSEDGTPLPQMPELAMFWCRGGIDDFRDEKRVMIDEDMDSLVQAVLEDCSAGTMCQIWYLTELDYKHSLDLQFRTSEGYRSAVTLQVSADNEATWAWLTERGYHADAEK